MDQPVASPATGCGYCPGGVDGVVDGAADGGGGAVGSGGVFWRRGCA